MDIGNKQLIFPGAGEVQIILPPGSITTPLAEAPSGHLCMIIDNYSEVPTNKGGIETKVQPLKLPSNPNSSSSSSGSGLKVTWADLTDDQ